MKILKIAFPVVLIIAAIAGAKYMMGNQPEVKRQGPKQPVSVVEAIELTPVDYRIQVSSRGTVDPRTQTSVVAEVSGKITQITSKFREGSFFKKGDLLLTIDKRDYKSAVTIAEADLAQQQVNLDTERANAKQALRDWQRLGTGGEPNDLVLRKPQLASAQAALEASRARLQQARTNLSRTEIRAPYDGRVLEKSSDLGQYVGPGQTLGAIYATDYVEIQLPVSDQQLKYLSLPESFEGETPDADAFPDVTISSNGHAWDGKIVRSAGAVDTKTRQQYLVAQVDSPYQRKDENTPPLKIGQFVQAHIEGEMLKNVFVIPNTAISSGGHIVLVNKDNKIRREQTEVLWSTNEETVVPAMDLDGSRLSITPMPLAVDGMKVRVKGDPEPAKKPDGDKPKAAKPEGSKP